MMNDEQFAWWLVGLVDGEGHFGVTRLSPTATRPSPHYRCIFRVSMAVDDADLLTASQARTGWGKLYGYNRKTTRANGTPHRPVTVWTVNTKAAVAEVADFFCKYQLQSKKSDEFAVWRTAVAAWQERTRAGRGNKDEKAHAALASAYKTLREMRNY